ncbi:MAG: class II aldolase/adducin family protein [Bacillota bacterium]|nr:class II aldolase/adducin family protein [Bacillota bacterium]
MANTVPFSEQYKQRLSGFVRMSKKAGSRSDYVQGGGGNTSCKVDDSLMAIKASGYRLDQIDMDQAYAVLDYQALRQFYQQTDPAGLADIEQAGSAQAKTATLTVEGLPALRPSVEAGFHSLLDTYVLHTHAIYANLVTCSAEGREVAASALADQGVGHAFVPYINPGAQLTFALLEAIEDKKKETGEKPGILFMQNHGFIVTGDDADGCLLLHDQVNEKLAAAYGVSAADWPKIAVRPAADPADGQTFISDTAWLRDRLLDQAWDLDFFTEQALYPDQLVFLGGKLGVAEGTLAEVRENGAAGLNSLKDTCTIFRRTGEVFYRCGKNEAQTIEETLCAILFITRTIRQASRTICTMSEAGRQFISNWESEQYRKTITAR